METIEALRRRIENIEALHSLVRTMKVLASVNIRQYERALQSLGEYYRTIEMGLQVVLQNRPPGVAVERSTEFTRLAAVVFGSDQGLCGQFNEQIASYAIQQMNQLPGRPEDRVVVALGARVTARLEEAGQPIEESLAVPGSLASVTPMVQEILMKLERWRANRGVDHVYLFFNRPLSGATYRPSTRHLLPVNQSLFQRVEQQPWPSRVLPTYTMDWDRLLSALIYQYLFVSLYRTFVESLASENSSRIAAMQVAEKNVEEHLTELEALFHNRRQSSITNEILDITSGFEALAAEWKK